jgi:type I restriction enzyme S subunit
MYSLFVFDRSAACIVAHLDSVQARLASLRELQSASGEELSALMPSILDKAFKGEL